MSKFIAKNRDTGNKSHKLRYSKLKVIGAVIVTMAQTKVYNIQL